MIRRCKIIGGNGAVNVYGPGLLFEDNEIVMNARETKPNGEASIALFLKDADGSIVRWFASTILAGRRQLSWPVKRGFLSPSFSSAAA